MANHSVDSIINLINKHVPAHKMHEIRDAIDARIDSTLKKWRNPILAVTVPEFTPGPIPDDVVLFLKTIFDHNSHYDNRQPPPPSREYIELISAWHEVYESTPLTLEELIRGAESLADQTSKTRLLYALKKCDPDFNPTKLGLQLRWLINRDIGGAMLANYGKKKMRTQWIVTKFTPQP